MSLRIITPGVVANPLYGKSSPVDWVVNTDGTSPVWAGWVHALSAHIGRSSEGNALVDVSGNGRNMVQTGGNATQIGTLADGFYPQGGVYLSPSGTQADIFADGVAGEMTFLQFAFSPGANAGLLGMQPATGAGNTARAQVQANATYNAQVVSWYGTGNANATGPTPIDARRASEVFMYGGTFSLTAIANFFAFSDETPIITPFTPTSTSGGAMGGPAWRIMRSSNTPLGTRVLLTVVYNRILTPAEIRLAQLGGRALLDAKGLL